MIKYRYQEINTLYLYQNEFYFTTMAHSRTNFLLLGFSGKLGKQFVVRNVNGMVVLSALPERRKKKATGKQAETCQRFRMAAAWAKEQLADPVKLAGYRLRARPGQTAYNVAVSDYLKAHANDAKGTQGTSK
jgi:hypothetical protein